MEENKFWLRLWQSAMVCFTVVIIAGVSSCQMSREKMVRAVESGANPIEVACMFQVERIGEITCHELATD